MSRNVGWYRFIVRAGEDRASLLVGSPRRRCHQLSDRTGQQIKRDGERCLSGALEIVVANWLGNCVLIIL